MSLTDMVAFQNKLQTDNNKYPQYVTPEILSTDKITKKEENNL